MNQVVMLRRLGSSVLCWSYLLSNRLPLHVPPVALQLKQIGLTQCPGSIFPQFASVFAAWHVLNNWSIETNIRAFYGDSRYPEGAVALHCLLVVGQYILYCTFVGQSCVNNAWIPVCLFSSLSNYI